jgi:hypothetical protein
MAQHVSTNTFGTAKWIVDPSLVSGTHSTIAGAIASASAGDSIFIRPGTYTENLTLKSEVNFFASDFFGGSGTSTKIIGKIIDNGVTCNNTFTNISFQTNSDFVFSLTGSASSVITSLCNFDFTNHTGNSVSTGSTLECITCNFDLATTGIGYHTASGSIIYSNCGFSNSGNSTTISTSTGKLDIVFCVVRAPISVSGASGLLNINDSIFDLSVINQTCVTVGASSTAYINYTQFVPIVATGLIIDGTANMAYCIVNSYVTNAISGSGTLNYNDITFTGSSHTIAVTTTTNFVKAAGTLITKYLVNSTWTPNPNAKVIEFFVWGGGAGGGSGRSGISNAASGGGGGGPGFLAHQKIDASLLTSAPYTITIGTGGAGGAAVSTATTNGNPGVDGTPSSVGSVIIALGGLHGLGGTTTGNSTTGSGYYIDTGILTVSSTANGLTGAGTSVAAAYFGWATTGAGGAGYVGTVPHVGGVGGAIVQGDLTTVMVAGGLAGSSAGGDGGNGNSPVGQPLTIGGTGGGSGGHDGTITAGKGGNGAVPGGGGGGGAGNLSTNASGAGGSGADGQILIIEYF